MKNNRHLNSLELKLAELHENYGNCIISEDESCEQYYIESDTDSWTTDSKAELMETIIYDLNEWFSDENAFHNVAADKTIETVGDYLPLFLALPNDCTVLAVGNGVVTAPSTTTAKLYKSAFGERFLIIYDDEQDPNCERSFDTLEELFPSAETWTEYSEKADRTFIMEQRKGVLSCVGWYWGEPNEEATEIYKGKLTATYGNIEEMQKPKAEEPTESECKPPYYEEPKMQCFYTGGGIYCTIYQLSGKMSDYYYGFGSEDENGTMCLYSHKGDAECNDDEYGFYDVVKYIDIEKDATEAEKWIYFEMAECEQNTMKADGCFAEEYSRF